MGVTYLDSRSIDYHNYRWLRSRVSWMSNSQYFSRLFAYAQGLMTERQLKVLEKRMKVILKWCQVDSLFQLEMYLSTNPDYLSYIFVREKMMRVCGVNVLRKRKVTKYEIIGRLVELAEYVDGCVEKNKAFIPFIQVSHQSQA